MMGATYKAWCVLKVIPSTSAQGDGSMYTASALSPSAASILNSLGCLK